MKKLVYLLSIGLLLAFATQATAQNRKQKKDEIKQRIYERKVEFIKEKVPMTAEEEKAFWPMYNEYNQKKDAIRKKFRETKKQQRKNGTTDYEKMNDLSIQIIVDEANLTADFYQKMKKILPAQKIHLVFEAEKDFKKQLLDKVRESSETKD
jgi:hypothetical protein